MATKKQQLALEIARAVGAGKAVAMETVDFNDPNRPKTCLEVDFPILPVNQVAVIEGNAGKPIYQMSKWWARRRSSVFRSMLIAAATRAPDDPAHAAKLVWDNYYANHQKKGAFKHLKVADIFMGGGTTVVEGSRLGMHIFGNDLNPVAWFVVKQELADADEDEIKQLLSDIEAEVKPQILPFYCCDGPNGEKGQWKDKVTGQLMGSEFDPLSLRPEERKNYTYEGPQLIYTFWAKHGTCQVTGCGHHTPIMTTPVLAVKTLQVRYWKHACSKCGGLFHAEEALVRMAPDLPLCIAPNEHAYSVIDLFRGVVCPRCDHSEIIKLGKSEKKNVSLSLVLLPEWFTGSPRTDSAGQSFGGSAQDDAASTIRWNLDCASRRRGIEVRGLLPESIKIAGSPNVVHTGTLGGTVPKKSHFACARCGTAQDILESTYATTKTAPYYPIMVQGISPRQREQGKPYGGRFFAYADLRAINAAEQEWELRRNGDLAGFWPTEELPYGLEADFWSVRRHGYTHWYTMFNHRQLLGLAILGKAIATRRGKYSDTSVDLVTAAFQQFVRNQCMMTVWNIGADKLEPQFAKNNFRPKAIPVENSFFLPEGRGNWTSCIEGIFDTIAWSNDPWELVASNGRAETTAKSIKVKTGDAVCRSTTISCSSSTELTYIGDNSLDLCITDPPFGNLMQYAEWSDFFYVWLRPLLKTVYPELFSNEFTPRALEVVSNKARNPENPNEFYRRLLTNCWSTLHRKMKPGGLLAFTFHHSQDGPWVDVLQSLFEAGFILEATFPVRGDETKGEGQYGSQKVEYDIIHVCRKRIEEPTPVSWARMRREVLQDVRQLQQLLENHAKEGLPEADIQVIKRGKALEYFSRHYEKVYVDEGRPISVKDALVGINQLIDETSGKGSEPPPVTAEPVTRQFLRIFDGTTSQPRDQMQKFLRGSGMAPEEFEQRGWSTEEQKVFHVISPLDLAQSWVGRHRRNMTSDYDQAMFLIGACYDGSGINAAETLKNENFRPHPALKALLEWHSRRGAKQEIRNAGSRALSIYQNWENTHQEQVKQQLSFFEDA